MIDKYILVSIIKEKIHKHKSLLESFFSLSVLNGLNVLLPLITLPYILRVVGAANYGIYAYVYVLIQYLLLFNQFGFRYSATKQIAQSRDDNEKVNSIYNSVLAFRLLLLLLGSILFFLLSPLLLETKEMKLMFLMGLGVVIGDTLNPVWLFQGMEKMRYITYANLFAKLLFTFLIFLLIREPDDYLYIMLYNGLGYMLGGVIGTIMAIRIFDIKLSRVKWKDIMYQYKEGLAIFGSTVGVRLYANANIFILKFFVDDATLGVYAAAEKVIKGFQLLASPISQALFPHLGHTFKKQAVNQSIKQLKKISIKLAILFLLIFILVFIFAEPIINLVAGSGYADAVIIVRIMSLIIFIGGINNFLGFVGLVNIGQQKSFMLFVLMSGFISIIFLLSTISNLGVISAPISMVLAEFLLLIVIFLRLRFIQKRV